ncbi:MAG: lipopolysaccharide heptosyltransferase II [Candidatus Omnitrophica bacterium]|nr:lipopolysaccharide heptosyltransferase II [Candidatus Omnitrophota bacterium]
MSNRTTISRILVTRTDRIGDVVLSTPVFEVLRRHFPTAHISVLVTPKTRETVEGNPFINEVLIYDKEGAHRSLWGSFLFSRMLRHKKFDIALILHSTNRVVLLSYLAGIPVRIGYERRLSFLLTRRFADIKKTGLMHEIDGNLELIRKGLGIEDLRYTCLYFPLRQETRDAVRKRFRETGLERKRYVAVHAQASCPSKCWPLEHFRTLIHRIVTELGLKVAIVGGARDTALTAALASECAGSVIDFTGRLSLGELGWVLKWARLFVSNDSGPVHISAAVTTPCIALFGRRQDGLSPARWGPVGERDAVFHKDAGCEVCYAHDCTRGFECLRLITPDEVYEKVEELVREARFTDEG